MNVKVVLLPDGEDHDSFARKHNASQFAEFIRQNETDFIRFKTRLLLDDAGTDPIKEESGDKVSQSAPSSKRGSPYLRKTLFVIMTILLQLQPQEDPVYQFLDKKRSEGKPYYVYMTAGGTKFLRVYYGKVRDCLKAKGLWEVPASASQEVNPG